MEAADIYSVANENQFRAKRIGRFKERQHWSNLKEKTTS